MQLENALAAARMHATTSVQLRSARTALARAELQRESISDLEDALRDMRTELEGQRAARIEAERTVAVQGAQRKDQEERMSDLKSKLSAARDACLRSEGRNADLSHRAREGSVGFYGEKRFGLPGPSISRTLPRATPARSLHAGDGIA